MEKMKKALSFLWPYMIILIMSLCGTYLVFYKGVVMGHDYKFHVGNVIEQYETLLNHKTLPPISGILAMGLGNGTRLFYAPLPHLNVTLIALFIRIFNLDILDAFKIVLVISVFVSGIFMYRFTMHFTNDNKIASILASGVFILFPYRLFDAFVRFAFAEAYAIMFLPLFFMGLYDITHIKDKVTSLPFIEVILGGSLLFLSHNLTAFYAYIFGIIYLLFNIKNIVNMFKKEQYFSHCAISVMLLIGIASISLFSELELMKLNIYVVNNDAEMWADIAHVIGRTNEEFIYSGFLRIKGLSYYLPEFFNKSDLTWGIILFILGGLITILVDIILSNIKTIRKYSLLISLPIMFAIISIKGRRIEIYLAAIIFCLIYSFIKYYYHKDDNKVSDKLYLNPMLYFTILSIVACFILMHYEWPWKILPSMFLKIQFPWRLWAFVQIFASMLVGLLAHYLNFKNVGAFTLTILVSLLLVCNNTLPDKRANYYLNYDKTWVEDVDYNLLDMGGAIGFNKEYIPKVFKDKNYKPEHGNSLYYKIAPKIKYNFDKYEDYMYDPIFLEGNGTINVSKAFSPKYEMEINAIEDALIQMPLIYYPGYQIKVTDLNTNEIYKVDSSNVDGLVSFNLKEGSYKVSLNYKGTTIRKVSKAYTYTSIGLTGLLLIYGIFFENKRRKEDEA